MALPRSTDHRFEWLLSVLFLVTAFFGAEARASQAAPEGAGSEPCALISDFVGSIQILDESRAHLIEGEKNAAISCGGWVSAESGWVKIRHRDGYVIHLSQGSFAQFPQGPGDSVVLFKGQAYARASTGMPRLDLITANARARVSRGSIILIYEPGSEMSQVIALQGEASFENRFQAARKVQVKAGESSQVNLHLLRVLPSLPSAIALSSLKPRFADLKVGEREEEIGTRKVVARAARKFVPAEAVARHSAVEKDEEPAHPRRSIAGLEFEAHLVQKLAGGQKIPRKMLFPGGGAKKAAPAVVEVVDPAEKFVRKMKQEEDQERRRLIDALSQIRIE